MYQSLFIVGILGAYELFKKYLLMTLNKNSLNLTGKESLGQLLYKLKNKNIIYGFDEFLDKDLRNALSHDWYWFSKNIFYYTIDPDLKRTKSLSLGELMIKKITIEIFTNSFMNNASERILYHKKKDSDKK